MGFGISGSSAVVGPRERSGVRDLGLKFGGFIRIRVAPLALVVFLKGAVNIASEKVDSGFSLFKYWFMGELHRQMKPNEPDHEKIVEYAMKMERRLGVLDPVFGSADRPCLVCRDLWQVINAERMMALRTSLGIKAWKVVHRRMEALDRNVIQVVKGFRWDVRQTEHFLHHERYTMERIRQIYGLHMPWNFKLMTHIGSLKERGARVRRLLLQTLAEVQKLETTALAKELTELAIHDFFDANWKPSDDWNYDCEKAPLAGSTVLAECEGGGYGCYPRLHDGRRIDEWTRSRFKEERLRLVHENLADGRVVLITRPRLLCSLMEGYGSIESDRGHPLSVDEVVHDGFYQHKGSWDWFKKSHVRLPHQALLILPRLFGLLHSLQTPVEYGGKMHEESFEKSDGVRILSAKDDKQLHELEHLREEILKAMGDEDSAIKHLHDDHMQLVLTHWETAGSACRAPPTHESLSRCAREGLGGRLFAVTTQQQIVTSLKTQLKKVLEGKEPVKREVEITWDFDGHFEVDLTLGSTEFGYCEGGSSLLHFAWNTKALNHETVSETVLGRVLVDVKHKPFPLQGFELEIDPPEMGWVSTSYEYAENAPSVGAIISFQDPTNPNPIKISWANSLTMSVLLIPFSGTAATVQRIAMHIAEVVFACVDASVLPRMPGKEHQPTHEHDEGRKHRLISILQGMAKAFYEELFAHPVIKGLDIVAAAAAPFTDEIAVSGSLKLSVVLEFASDFSTPPRVSAALELGDTVAFELPFAAEVEEASGVPGFNAFASMTYSLDLSGLWLWQRCRLPGNEPEFGELLAVQSNTTGKQPLPHVRARHSFGGTW